MEGPNRYYSNQTRGEKNQWQDQYRGDDYYGSQSDRTYGQSNRDWNRQGDYYEARNNRSEPRSEERPEERQKWTANYPTSDQDFWQSRGSNYISPSKWHDHRSREYGLTPGYFNNYQSDRSQMRASSEDYSGRGPKGYQRADERIREDVCEALMHSPYVDASSIEVGVKDGIVTLKGTVSERRMKRMAEDCAERASSVKDVRNELSVSSDSGEMLSPRAKTAFKNSDKTPDKTGRTDDSVGRSMN